MRKFFLVFLVAAWLLTACASKSKSASLIGDWKLTAYGAADSPQTAVPGIEAVLTFDSQGKVSGSLGCNHFGGGYKLKGDQISFDSVAATLMACPEPQMQQEQAAFKVMTGSVDYKIEGSTLTLTKEGEVLVFETGE